MYYINYKNTYVHCYIASMDTIAIGEWLALWGESNKPSVLCYVYITMHCVDS